MPAMARAWYEDRKTQTRRIVKIARDQAGQWADAAHPARDGMPVFWWSDLNGRAVAGRAEITLQAYDTGAVCPYGGPGDRLWIREAIYRGADGWAYYGVDNEPLGTLWTWQVAKLSARYMPRYACRSYGEIADVRVERVQDISEADALAEGSNWTAAGDAYPWTMSARMNFVDLWDTINGPRGYGWASNPWVWALTLRRLPA